MNTTESAVERFRGEFLRIKSLIYRDEKDPTLPDAIQERLESVFAEELETARREGREEAVDFIKGKSEQVTDKLWYVSTEDLAKALQDKK